MPESLVGGEKISQYIEKNNISIADLAAMYGIGKQDMTDYLSGRIRSPKGHKVIIRIISDFKIR